MDEGEKDGMIGEDANHMIEVGWNELEKCFKILCIYRIPIKLKDKIL